ncbi:uncharacterized protein LOC144577180 [Callithrix jacchus]
MVPECRYPPAPPSWCAPRWFRCSAVGVAEGVPETPGRGPQPDDDDGCGGWGKKKPVVGTGASEEKNSDSQAEAAPPSLEPAPSFPLNRGRAHRGEVRRGPRKVREVTGQLWTGRQPPGRHVQYPAQPFSPWGSACPLDGSLEGRPFSVPATRAPQSETPLDVHRKGRCC